MINLSKYLLLIYLLLKPYYFFKSGGMQPADVLLILSAITLFIGLWHTKSGRSKIKKQIQENRLFIIFVACTIIINVLYFLVYPDFKFLLSSLYFIFNLIAILTFSLLLKDKIFLNRVASVFKFNMLVQLGIWAGGVGRYYSPDRYMGTFNDPNQFGYYILLSLLFIYFIDFILKNKRTYIYYFLALFLIIQSGSTGMLLGMSVFTLSFGIIIIWRQLKSPYKLIRRILYSLAVVIVVAMPIVLAVIPIINDSGRTIGVSQEDSALQSRFDEKIDKASGEGSISIIQDRNLDIITEYPYYMLFGSGEGRLLRFERATYPGSEIHSTFPSILFYYGIIPLGTLVVWIYRKISGVPLDIMIVYITLFATSFILLNQRQALFWVIISLGGLVGSELVYKSRKERKV